MIVPDHAAEVTARTAGKLASVQVRVGDRVAAGAVVAELEIRDLEQELAEIRAQLQVADAERVHAGVAVAEAADTLERRRAMAGVIPAREVEQARFALDRARAVEARAAAEVSRARAAVTRATQRRDDATLRAPFAGTVAARYADPGTAVDRDTPVVRLISADRLWVRFAAPAAIVGELAPGTRVAVRIAGIADALAAEVEHIAPELDPALQTVAVDAALAVPERHARDVRAGQDAVVTLASDRAAR